LVRGEGKSHQRWVEAGEKPLGAHETETEPKGSLVNKTRKCNPDEIPEHVKKSL